MRHIQAKIDTDLYIKAKDYVVRSCMTLDELLKHSLELFLTTEEKRSKKETLKGSNSLRNINQKGDIK